MSFNSSHSAESGSKSKRSFNSTSSHRTGNSNNSDTSKKKKTTQKTLGMAWGSNSRSSSRASFLNSPFSDFGSYMAVKNQKLQEQFEAEATNFSNDGSNKSKPIFQGVSIFVDGFTVPSNQELKGYMLKHGGRFENYFSRHRVTHIICSNLPDRKIKNLRSFSAGLPVVKPAWLLDSVVTNKLLSWVPYQLDQVASETNNQPKLSSFLALKSRSISNDSRTCVTGHIKSDIKEDPSLKGVTIKEPALSGPCTEHLRPCSRDWDESVHGNSTSVIEATTLTNGKYSEWNLAEPSNDFAIVKASVDDLNQASPSRPSASVNSNTAKNSTSLAIAGPSKRRHSTLVDPKFVENYFKKSRLHFIDTWRSRYRKRFPSSTHTSSNVNASVQRTSVIHVDMDSFFVSVVIRNHPELRDKPVAVCHSDNPLGTAEISSANYPARDYGVRAGIFVRDAKALCPHLTIFPYDFDAYEEVADQFYNILHKHCNKVQAVSCDEAFLEVRDLEVEDPQIFASLVRKDIFETTGCTASAGISVNFLMARLATKAAKPDGQYYISPEKVDDYLNELPIKSLPGIGHVSEEKLKRRQIQMCGQLRMISKESLQKEFGVKTGDMLWNFSRGVDNRLVGVIQENKSVGAEVNWGVRFSDMKDCQHFLRNLCNEVSLRLQGCAVEGRSFTLKIKKRRNAEEPVKYMGCGDCENLSHSVTVPMATDDVDIMRRITTQLFGLFHIDVQDIRGMGLQVSKLESVDTAKKGNERNYIRSWLASASASTKEQREIGSPAEKSASREFENQHIDENLGRFSANLVGASGKIGTNSENSEAPSNQDLALPALGDVDLGVVESLPPDLFSELNDIYHGKLINLISKKKGKHVAPERVQVAMKEGSRPFWRDPTHVNEKPVVDKEENYPVDKFEAGTSNVGISTVVLNKNDLMPSSLSQVDASVLQQLPEELRMDILQLFPARRQPECAPDVYLDPSSKSKELLFLKSPENQPSNPTKELWAENPPEWVAMFKHSNCRIMQILADTYYKSGSTCQLSSILQCMFSESQLLVDPSNDGWDNAISCLCDLLKQYIKLKVETDIEEIYVCFRLLRRFTTKSKLFAQVYSVIFPHLQASVGETYGGSLHI